MIQLELVTIDQFVHSHLGLLDEFEHREKGLPLAAEKPVSLSKTQSGAAACFR